MRKYNKENYIDEYQIPKNTEEVIMMVDDGIEYVPKKIYNELYEEYQKNKFDKISNILFYIIMLEIGFFIGLILGGILR